MEMKQMQWQIKGMNRDLSVSKFSREFSYENMNLRLVTSDGNTMLSLVSETGPEEMIIYKEGIVNEVLEFQGTPIGYCILNTYLVLFFAGATDYIYRIDFSGNRPLGRVLHSGDMNFSVADPIETLGFYEAADIQKVYWTDGMNPLRMINIADTKAINYSDDFFDFVPALQLNAEIDIQRNTVSNGEFSPGVIQYCFSYINPYGQQSNIFYTSTLYYCSLQDNGVSPDSKVSNTFSISLTKLDTRFKLLRIYSIHRSSENGTPYCKRVADVEIPSNGKVFYEDNNLNGDTIDPAELLYIGGESISAGTFAQKDNVLFLGNIKTNRPVIDSSIKNVLKFTSQSEFSEDITKDILEDAMVGSYFHKNQLSYPSRSIKYFKAGETYRFGVQFQYKTGKWSEAVWLGDYRVKTRPKTIKRSEGFGGAVFRFPVISANLVGTEVLTTLKNKGFVKARPVVVFPKMNERESVCQGLLCPTVYNVADRAANGPFVQSSWYPRPDSPYNIYVRDPSVIDYISNNSVVDKNGDVREVVTDRSGFGKWAEFRHNELISGCAESNAEIQCNYHDITKHPKDVLTYPEINNLQKKEEWLDRYSTDFFVDKSIVTLHSPDIEFNSEVINRDFAGLQLRIVGKVNFTANAFDIDIMTSTPQRTFLDGLSADGFYKETINVKNISKHGWKGGMAMPYWFDQYFGFQGASDAEYKQGFVVYPWHRYGSLNDQPAAESGNRTAMIKRKLMSNFKVSAETQYFSDGYSWTPPNGISGAELFNSNEMTLTRIKAPENSGLGDLNYYGNIDKLLNNSEGYPIIVSKVDNLKYSDPSHLAYAYPWKGCGSKTKDEDGNACTLYTKYSWGRDPVRMKYKSTPHAVMAFNYVYNKDTWRYDQVILPTSKDPFGHILETPKSDYCPFWNWLSENYRTLNVNQFCIEREEIESGYGYLWIGELYNPEAVNKTNRFGGTTEDAIAANEWLVAGEPVDISTEGTTLVWIEGDTYYQRYDHIKTYPFSPDDYQSLIEIVSFMCETRVNLDGRYDKNRGLTSNLHITPENFNQINQAYNQINNFFTYHSINTNLINPSDYPTSITWTLPKVSGSIVDEWTHITLGASLELDGDKGPVTSLNTFRDKIYSFQDKGIAQIMFNENMQLTTTTGVPIELGNSGKVEGKRYISETQGCTNKWSICESPSALYFIDSLNKDICVLTENVQSLSKTKGFYSWSSNNIHNTLWTPLAFNSFVSYFDAKNNDILFINNDSCLAYSELMGQFSSFYNYEHVPYVLNVNGTTVMLQKKRNSESKEFEGNYKLWKHNSGQYNNYFGAMYPYYVTLVANDNPTLDKTFTNMEYRADVTNLSSLQDSKPFQFIKIWNEFQEASAELKVILGKSSNLKQKFRIWRADIPRHRYTTPGGIIKTDRIRNPWAYITLSKEDVENKCTEIHDIMCNYLI